MTRLFNDASDFAAELRDGFVYANSKWVRPVPGGVVRAASSSAPQVAVVIGGGSGHYPAFAGFVGPGLAAGAVMGNLFASPSARQVETVSRHAEEGRGVLLSFGNYAGDVLHFCEAADRLRAEGIDVRVVTVTDDIWSAPADQRDRRRGIAGDVTVFKVAGAAAARGDDLDDVERLANKANDRTRSFGVAFAGCTLPGAREPLFSVAPGRMAVGLGIHGEPGIDEVEVPTADELAEMFVSRLLAEIPAGVEAEGSRVVPILNGLGAVKYEELFVVYRSVHRLLEAAGVQVVDPQVGEFCTSFDMAGASLTLFWIDDELGHLWAAPAHSSAFHSNETLDPVVIDARDLSRDVAQVRAVAEASATSRECARQAVGMLAGVADAFDDAADELGRIDRIAGDGDHGIGMQRGSRSAATAAKSAFAAGAGVGDVLHVAGEAWSDDGGGTSGAIWGRMLVSAGESLGNQDAVTPELCVAALRRLPDTVTKFGGARVGDKTMVDALVPLVSVVIASLEAGESAREAWRAGADAARSAAQSTSDLVPRLGRARSHGEKSLGTPDPGALSLALVAETIHSALADVATRKGSDR